MKGLRRDEVAEAAGISVEYYTKLEQGRMRRPLLPIVTALSGALRLDSSEQKHLLHLFGYHWAHPDDTDRSRPEIDDLLSAMGCLPGYVVDHRMAVIHSNRLARRLLLQDRPGKTAGNLAEFVFLDPAARNYYVDLPEKTTAVAAMLRFAQGRMPRDPALGTLISRLSAESSEFGMFWQRHDVLEKHHGRHAIFDPAGGVLDLRFESLPFPSNDLHRLVVYYPAPDSTIAQRLTQLDAE